MQLLLLNLPNNISHTIEITFQGFKQAVGCLLDLRVLRIVLKLLP